MQEINDAYAVLRDPDKRKEYDLSIGITNTSRGQTASTHAIRNPAALASARIATSAEYPRSMPEVRSVGCNSEIR